MTKHFAPFLSLAIVAMVVPGNARADEAALLAELEALRATVERQQQRLDAQETRLEEQEARLRRLGPGAPIASLETLAELRGAGSPGVEEEPVGVAPSVTVNAPSLERRGGVLTPAGLLVMEPETQYSVSTRNRFEFDGIGVADVLLVGQIEASDAQQETMISSVNARLGASDRLELTARVPFVQRRSRVSDRIVDSTGDPASSQTLDGLGLGDVEIGARYLLNPRSTEPGIWIGSLRIKTNTGRGPFEVDRDVEGIESELATGSGFWTVEPGVTFILPSDPVALYGSMSYAWSLPYSVDRTIRAGESPLRVGDVDPGDAVNLSFGLGISLNDRTSLNIGYAHQVVTRSRTELDRQTVSGEALQIGELVFGFGYHLRRGPRVQLTLGVGVTEDAPNVRLSLRVPFSREIF